MTVDKPTKPKPTATPTPTPAPSGGNLTVAQVLAQANAGADNTKSGQKSTNLYGLGEWGSQAVNPGDLPVTVNLAAGAQQTTGDAIVEAFAHGRPEQQATIQHALAMGGYYPASYTPKYGVISSEDVAAFARAVKTAGQAGQSVSDLLSAQAQYGAAAGVAAAQQQTQTRKSEVTTVTLPNTQDLEAEADAAFQKIVGKKASPEQAARFAAFYRSMVAGAQRAQNQAMYDATNPAPLPNALAQADAGQLAGSAAGDVTVQGPANAGNLNPAVNTGGAANDPYVTPTFSDKVGGLMSLGQAVAQAQQHGISPTGGLTQITQDSVPSANVAAENFARNADPHGAAANDTANTFNTFLSLLTRNFG